MSENNGKIVFPAVVAFLLVLSVFAFSGRGSDGSALEINSGTETGINANTGNALKVKVNSENETEIEDESGDDNSGRGENIREKIKERVETAKENFENRMEKAKELREKFLEAKAKAAVSVDAFVEAREKLRNAKPNDRNGLREGLRVRSRIALLNQVDAALKNLQSLQQNGIATVDVNAAIEFFLQEQVKLQDENITASELVQVSKEIKEYWQEHRFLIKKRIGVEISARLEALINKAQNFSMRISKVIEALHDLNKDTGLLERAQDKLDTDINLFVELNAKVKVALGEADSRKDVGKLLDRAHGLLNEMNKQLNMDFRLMKGLFKATRELNVSSNIEAQTEQELIAEIESPNEDLVRSEQEFESELEAEGGDGQ